MSLPKFKFESVPLPKGELLGAVPGAEDGAGVALGAWVDVGAGEEPKPAKGAAESLAGAAAGVPKPPKLNGEDAAAGFCAGVEDAAGAAEAGAAGLGAGEELKPANPPDEGLGAAGLGAPEPPKSKGVEGAAAFGA